MTGKSILVVEDDEHIRELLDNQIASLGFQVDHATTGKAGVQKALQNDYALIILDIMLPELGGIEVCQEIRKSDRRVPIMMLTAKGDELDRVMGLELGADDYLTKPFSIPELKARIKALIRRAEQGAAPIPPADEMLKFHELQIDAGRRIVLLRGQPLELSALEFDFLLFLARHPGRPFTRSALLEEVWGASSEAYEKNVNTLITRLRKKIETNPANPSYIITVWGVGYKFTESFSTPGERES